MIAPFGTALILCWLALPPLVLALNATRRVRLHPLLLFAITVTIGFALLVTSAWAWDVSLKAEMDRFDLDGDGGIGGAELTPDAQRAMDAWASDTGRTMVIFTGFPVTAIWAGFWFLCLCVGEWTVAAVANLFRLCRGRR